MDFLMANNKMDHCAYEVPSGTWDADPFDDFDDNGGSQKLPPIVQYYCNSYCINYLQS